MTNVNNLFGIRVNTIMNNGSINFGHNTHSSHYVNMKINTGYLQTGDANHSPMQFNNVNDVIDMNNSDQGQKQV